MCGIKLKYFLLVLFLLSAVLSFSLSQKEVDQLPMLDNQTLIQIILEYDKGMSGLETSLTEKQNELNKKENSLNEIRALLKTQEQLSAISYETQTNLLKDNNQLKVWLYIAGGVILGEAVYIIGGLTGQ